MRALIVAWLLAAGALSCPGPALGITIHVPGGQPTIQAGIDAASAGDTVLVAPGTYAESLVMRSGVTLRSESGVPTTVVRGSEGASCLRCEGLSEVFIEGMVFTGGGGTVRGNDRVGGGILCVGSEVVVTGCEIRECVLPGAYPRYERKLGAGVACVEGSAVLLTGCAIEANYIADESEWMVEDRGGGLYCDALSSAVVRSCRIADNVARIGGGLGSNGFSLLAEDCVMEGNAAYWGAAVCGSGTFRRCVMRDCRSLTNFDAGGGLRLDDESLVEECLIYGNTCFYGGGIHVYYAHGPVTIRHNTIYGNRAYEGAGIFVETSPENPVPVTLEGNIVAGNGRDGAGVGVVIWGACPPFHTVRCNDVWGNLEGEYAGCPDPTGTEGNISADPLFCGAETGDFQLDCASPCAPAHQPDCGLIGALDVGCGGPSATVPATWGLVKHRFDSGEK